jgi:hypothetical protein
VSHDTKLTVDLIFDLVAFVLNLLLSEDGSQDDEAEKSAEVVQDLRSR